MSWCWLEGERFCCGRGRPGSGAAPCPEPPEVRREPGCSIRNQLEREMPLGRCPGCRSRAECCLFYFPWFVKRELCRSSSPAPSSASQTGWCSAGGSNARAAPCLVLGLQPPTRGKSSARPRGARQKGSAVVISKTPSLWGTHPREQMLGTQGSLILLQLCGRFGQERGNLGTEAAGAAIWEALGRGIASPRPQGGKLLASHPAAPSGPVPDAGSRRHRALRAR